MKLTKTDISLNREFSSKKEAILASAQILFENGCVDEEYGQAMLDRENIVSTYMGNFIAIPHGTDDAKKSIKKTGISIIQVPKGVSFASEGEEEDKLVFVIFGIAGKDGEHLELLSKIAIFCSEEENVVKLFNAKTEEEVIQLLNN